MHADKHVFVKYAKRVHTSKILGDVFKCGDMVVLMQYWFYLFWVQIDQQSCKCDQRFFYIFVDDEHSSMVHKLYMINTINFCVFI